MKKTKSLWLCLFLSAFATTAFAQKVNVGYDKSGRDKPTRGLSWYATDQADALQHSDRKGR
jgi:hypothetical protein